MFKLFIILVISPMLALAQHERSEHWQERTKLFVQEADSLPKREIVFLGNSITEGFDLKIFFPDARPINRGISGDHTDGLLERLAYSVIKLKPSKLFILIGINDIGAGDKSTVILQNYHLLMEKLAGETPETQVFIQSILPTTQQWENCPQEKIIRINQELYKYCLKFNFTWIDIYKAFVTDKGYLNNYFSDDGLHLNNAGYIRWTEILKEYGLS